MWERAMRVYYSAYTNLQGTGVHGTELWVDFVDAAEELLALRPKEDEDKPLNPKWVRVGCVVEGNYEVDEDIRKDSENLLRRMRDFLESARVALAKCETLDE